MKWKARPEPMIGDTKTDIRMAWLPTRMDDGYVVWWEIYRVHLRYETRQVPTKAFITVPRTRWFDVYTETLW